MQINQILLKEIKSKKQIQDLEDEFILNKIEKYFLTNGDKRKKLEKEFESKKEKITKSKNFKEILKNIREEIGIVYGSFLTKDFSKKNKINLKDYETILSLHKSTRERIDYYNEIYGKIFNWYEPQKGIADLACGLNPISYPLMNQNVFYFASDLNPSDMKFINSFFKENDINGLAKNYDITNLEILKNDNFNKCDLVILFKALDSFEFVKKNISKELINGIKANHIVVSFPTKSLVSRKEFKSEKRNWFINFLEKEEYAYNTFEVENELFFLIEK